MFWAGDPAGFCFKIWRRPADCSQWRGRFFRESRRREGIGYERRVYGRRRRGGHARLPFDNRWTGTLLAILFEGKYGVSGGRVIHEMADVRRGIVLLVD